MCWFKVRVFFKVVLSAFELQKVCSLGECPAHLYGRFRLLSASMKSEHARYPPDLFSFFYVVAVLGHVPHRFRCCKLGFCGEAAEDNARVRASLICF